MELLLVTIDLGGEVGDLGLEGGEGLVGGPLSLRGDSKLIRLMYLELLVEYDLVKPFAARFEGVFLNF